jgi:RHS repeat-associated protein
LAHIDNLVIEEIFEVGEGYRFGFNGKEDDSEVEGQQDYGFRIYDKRLGRFKSTDPLEKEYPFYSPYQFASNSPIMAIDLDGLESQTAIDGTKKEGPYNMVKINDAIRTNQTKQEQAAMQKEATVKRVVRQNAATNKTEEPIIKINSGIKYGIAGAAEVKVLGFGLGASGGLSKSLISSTLSESQEAISANWKTGNWTLGGSLTLGPKTLGLDVNTDGAFSAKGSVGRWNGSISSSGSTSSEIEIFSIKAGAGLIGNISMSINTKSFMRSHVASPSSSITGFAPRDNTSAGIQPIRLTPKQTTISASKN